jgi:hypothetical protein
MVNKFIEELFQPYRVLCDVATTVIFLTGERFIHDAAIALGPDIDPSTVAGQYICKYGLLAMLLAYFIARITGVLKRTGVLLDSYDELRRRNRQDDPDDGPGGGGGGDGGGGGPDDDDDPTPEPPTGGGTPPDEAADQDEVYVTLGSRTTHIVVKLAAGGFVSVWVTTVIQHGPTLHL